MFKENCRMQLSGSGAGSETELARTFHLFLRIHPLGSQLKFTHLIEPLHCSVFENLLNSWSHFLTISPLLSHAFWFFRTSWGQNSCTGSFPEHLLSMPSTHCVRRDSFNIHPTDASGVSIRWQALRKAMRTRSVQEAYIPTGQTEPFGGTCCGKK